MMPFANTCGILGETCDFALREHQNFKMVSQEFLFKNLDEINKNYRSVAEGFISEALTNTRG